MNLNTLKIVSSQTFLCALNLLKTSYGALQKKIEIANFKSYIY